MRTRLLLVVMGAGFGVTLLGGWPVVQAKARAAPACAEAAEPQDGDGAVQLWITPRAPVAGRPLRVLAVSETSQGDAHLVVTALGGGRGDRAAAGAATGRAAAAPATAAAAATTATVRRGGAPWSYDAALANPGAGHYTVELVRDKKVLACRKVQVTASGQRPSGVGGAAERGTWTSPRAWDRAMENFYAAWIEVLFDAPVTDSLDFRPLSQALRDPQRNLFFDYLGLGEDDPKAKSALRAAPDCADLPYFLRGYFSWKMGLPFGLRDCDRGTASKPPRCGDLITNEMPLPAAPPGAKAKTTAKATAAIAKDPLAAVRKFLRLLANKVHSGSGRTALSDEKTDYYPVKLTRESLRPGTVFADPYGHVLMLVKWVPQTGDSGGILLAVDGQPDGSVARKRFWEGTFLYANDVAGAGAGFKAFRPLVRGGDGSLAPLSNAALRNDPRFASFSHDQQELSGDAFYARMGKLINPRGLDASAAHRETLDALVEQLETRIGSVDNGEKYMRENGNPLVPMPEGPKIFETMGPWEDYATPSRDMRLLIAMRVLQTLPERIVAHPELFNLGDRKPEAVRAEVEKLHAARIKERTIEYRRSDGSPQKLTVADLLARKSGFEVSYNPNDCVEIRWAAPEGSPEAATCKRRAPEDQRARMAQVRPWFQNTRRPAR